MQSTFITIIEKYKYIEKTQTHFPINQHWHSLTKERSWELHFVFLLMTTLDVIMTQDKEIPWSDASEYSGHVICLDQWAAELGGMANVRAEIDTERCKDLAYYLFLFMLWILMPTQPTTGSTVTLSVLTNE